MCAWLGSEGLREGTRSKGKHLEFKHVNINKQNMIQNLLPTCTWSHELKEPATWRDFFQILHTLWSETDNPVKGVVKMLASYIERVPFHWDKVKKLFSYLLGDRVNESNIDVLLLADTWRKYFQWKYSGVNDGKYFSFTQFKVFWVSEMDLK